MERTCTDAPGCSAERIEFTECSISESRGPLNPPLHGGGWEGEPEISATRLETYRKVAQAKTIGFNQ